MQVYKAYFKIVKRNKAQILIYIFVFILFAIILGGYADEPTARDFEESKVKIAIINEDSNSAISKGLVEYLGTNSEVVDVDNNKESLQNALYFREVEYIVTIPKGFANSYMNNGEIKLEKSVIPNSTSNIYMDSLINKYLNTAKIYYNNTDYLSEEEIISKVEDNLKVNCNVELASVNGNVETTDRFKHYYNYASYSIFAILILGVASVMLTFNNKELKKRNLVSPLKINRFNGELIVSNIVFALGVWLLFVISSVILYPDSILTKVGGLLILNSLVFTIAALSVAYIIGTVIRNRNAMSAAANVVALGSSFISGVFVPQELLGEKVKFIASFNPTYWYVKGNNEIAILTNFSMDNLKPIFTNMFIVGAFAIAIFAISIVISKKKAVS